MKKHHFLAWAVALAMASTAGAASITVLNSSFESPVTPWYNTGIIDDWTVAPTSSGGVFDPHNHPPDSPYYSAAALAKIDGTQVAYSNGGTISQTLSVDLAPNTLYNLSVLVGDRADVNNSSTTFSVSLYAGATLLATTGKADYASFDNDFITTSLSYLSSSIVLPNQALTIQLYSSGPQYNFDSVQLNGTAVPLPASSYAGLTLLGAWGLRRKLTRA